MPIAPQSEIMGEHQDDDPDAIESIGHVLGIAGVIVAIAGLALSIGLAQDFSLQENALSDLGGPDVDAPWIFNATVIIGGVFASIFFLTLIRRLSNRYQQIGVGLFLIASLSLVGVGLFPIDHDLHLGMAFGFFLGITLGLIVVGYGDREVGLERRSKIAWNLALLHIIAWSFAYMALDGVALPELVGVVAYGIWILITIIQRGRILPHDVI